MDFSDLPPARGKACTPHQSAIGEGQIVLVQAADLANSKKILPDLAVWLQCFALYVVALAPPPDRLQDLMAYHSFIAKCSLRYRWPSWVVYDQNFHLEVANQPDCLWARSDPSIYAQSFTNQTFLTENWCTECQSLDHSWAACPDAPVNALKLQLPVGAITKAKEYVIYATNLMVIVVMERIATLTMCVAYVLVPIHNQNVGTKRKENNHKTSYK